MFRKNKLPPFLESMSKPSEKATRSRGKQSSWFLLFYPEGGGSNFFRQWTYTGLHGVTSQKIILFMVTGVRTPQTTQLVYLFSCCCFGKIRRGSCGHHTVSYSILLQVSPSTFLLWRDIRRRLCNAVPMWRHIRHLKGWGWFLEEKVASVLPGEHW
jgi:hypothetical protein